MADITASLILPRRLSQESFHSTNSHHSDTLDNASGTIPDGLALHDVDTFLNDPQNQALLASKARFVAAAGPKPPKDDEAQRPVPIGHTQSSQNIQTLYYLCQQRGIVPEFEIDGDASTADWGGWLKINEHIIGSDERWPSKKATREGLAEKAIEIVKAVKVNEVPSSSSSSQTNWVGKLLEYHNIASPTIQPVYNDFAIGTLFACECTIPGHDEPFGGKENGFSTKKAARTNAAMEAVEFLISEGLLNEDGSIKSRKKPAKIGPTVRFESNALRVEKNASYSQRVTDFCPILGLTAPTYQFSASSTASPNMLTGFATFPLAFGLPPKIGEVRNVFGRKNAKEECARQVWQELKALAKKRGVEVADSEED